MARAEPLHRVVCDYVAGMTDRFALRAFEELVAPITTRLGLFKPDLALRPLLEQAGLVPDQVQRVNALNGWRLVRCINRK